MQEFYSWVPVLTAHHRRSSLELYHATVRGIGTYTGLGVNLLVGARIVTVKSRSEVVHFC